MSRRIPRSLSPLANTKLHGADVKQKCCRNSSIIGEIFVGDIITITQVQISCDNNRIRGKLSSGGWISLQNLTDGFVWVKKHMIGTKPVVKEEKPLFELID